MSDKVLSIEGINFGYERDINVLEDISLDIYEGEYVGIVGANGSAKSTLMKIMLGLLKPKGGAITLMGSDIESFSAWGSIGYLSQQVRTFNANFPATVSEVVGANLYSQKKFLKLLNKDDKKRIREVLRVVEMEEYSDRLVGSLSGGQQQRVFIARLLISNPKVIFMDEPLVGMDVKSQMGFYQILDRLSKDMHITLIMVTHDITEIFKRADRVLLLNQKRVEEYNLVGKGDGSRLETAREHIINII